MCCRWPCLLYPARVASPSKGGLSAQTSACRRVVSWRAGTAPAWACAAGGRVWSTQQGGRVWSSSKVTGVAACQAAAGVAGLDLLPGLSWTGGMLLYARHSGLMLESVPGHVCGHVRSMCPVWVYQYSNTLIGYSIHAGAAPNI